MYWQTAYYVAAALFIALAFGALTALGVRTRMRPAVLAALGTVLLIGVVGFVTYGPREQPTPASPRFQEQEGESAAGKNDSTTGKDEGARAREIVQTAGPLKISDEQRQQVRDFLARRSERTLDSVDLSLTVGAAVPRQVELHDLPAEISDALHGYNGDKYMLVRDQMIIVDSVARRIVAIIPAVNTSAGR